MSELPGAAERKGVIRVTSESDVRLFAAFALANVAGYNADNGWEFSHVRRAVRTKLAARSTYWRGALQETGLLSYLQRGGGAMLMDLVPHLSPPPSLTAGASLSLLTGWQAESRSTLQALPPLLRDFIEREPILAMWSDFRPDYEKEARLFNPAASHLCTIASRFGEPTGPDPLHLLVLPNLLDARGRGYSLSSPAQTWLFFGPMQDEVQAEEVAVHELLHRWVDRACDQRVRAENGLDPMPMAKARFRIVAELYPEFPIWVGETIVRAATTALIPNLRYVEAEAPHELLSYYERIGFLGIKDAYRRFTGNTGRPLLELVEECIDPVRRTILQECA